MAFSFMSLRFQMRAETHVGARNQTLTLLLVTLVLCWFDTDTNQQKYTDTCAYRHGMC